MSKTVEGLIAHCKKALANNVQYVYGAKMQVMSYNQIKALQNIYGKKCVWDSDLKKAGKLCCDCSGLISSYTGVMRGSTNFKDVAPNVVSLATLKANWKKYVGWALWHQGHIGVVSNKEGYYYAMDGSARNMVHLPLSKNNWTHCIQIKDIDYNVKVNTDTKTEKEETDMLVKKTLAINGIDNTFTINEINGKNYFPAEVLTSLGISVTFDPNTKKVSLSRPTQKINVLLNGKTTVSIDSVNIDGFNYIPIRTFEKLGATVTYDSSSNIPGININPTIRKIKVKFNGNDVKEIDAVLIDNLNYVQLRTLEKFDGIKVDYDKESNMPIITFNK